MNTREVGVAKVFQKIVELGGTDLAKEKEGNKSSITFTALNGKNIGFLPDLKIQVHGKLPLIMARLHRKSLMKLSFGSLLIFH